MKSIFILPLLLLVFSCKHIEPKELIGGWKIRDIVDQTAQNASEKTTFYNGDSLTIELFANSKIVEKYSGSYKFDTISKIIHIKIKKDRVFNFKVLKLTDSEMELQDVKQNQLIRYVKTN